MGGHGGPFASWGLVPNIFKGCRRCRRPRKGAAAAQGQIEGSSRCRIFVVSNAYKKKKNGFFEGCPVGWGGYPPELAWWTGG